MYKITFYVPVSHVEQVKQAMFAVGAGRIGEYDCCAWQVLGVGQFRPLAGATPFIGQLNTLEQVAEYKVEMVADDTCVLAAIMALKASHPYQQPAYDVFKIMEL